MSRRRRVISDPREIAGIVLDTPGLVDKLAESLVGVGEIDRALARATVVLSLVELANDWPGRVGWAIDNFGEPYKYER